MVVSEIFQRFVQVSAILPEHFPDAPAPGSETLTQYDSWHVVPDLPWLQERLPPLAELLLSPPAFKLQLKIEAAGYIVVSNIERDAGGELFLSRHEVNDSGLSIGSLPDETKIRLTEFTGLFANRDQRVDLDTVAQQATNLSGPALAVAAMLHLFFDKKTLNGSFRTATAGEVTAHIVSYLFQNQLVNKLANTTIDRFESEFLIPGRPTVFLVFDLDGGLASAFMSVCGQQQANEIEGALTTPLTADSVIRSDQSHRFRQWQSFGNFAPRWLIPEVVTFTVTHGEEQNIALVRDAFQRFQPALSAIFMADSLETDVNGVYSVEYRGLRPAKFQVEADQLVAQRAHWDDLYELYRYAYDGFSGDKLEVIQQYIGQFTQDLPGLFISARGIRETAKLSHDKVLAAKVEEYFETYQSVQERIQTAVAALATDMISLSREVSADAYKVMGIILLAIAGSFFKADIAVFALFLGFLAVAIYLLIVIVYHLPTLETGAALRKKQQDAYIQSFKNVFPEEQIQIFLNNENWQEARREFSQKYRWTQIIYAIFCVPSFIAVNSMAAWTLLSVPNIPPIPLPVMISAWYLSKSLLSYLPLA